MAWRTPPSDLLSWPMGPAVTRSGRSSARGQPTVSGVATTPTCVVAAPSAPAEERPGAERLAEPEPEPEQERNHAD